MKVSNAAVFMETEDIISVKACVCSGASLGGSILVVFTKPFKTQVQKIEIIIRDPFFTIFDAQSK